MRGNNFDALRLLGAALVLVGHCFVLSKAGPVPEVGGIPIHSLGLYVFFTLSGYLITTSWHRSPKLAIFARNRALRILPALLLVVIVSTFLLGPTASTLPLGSYFRQSATWNYLLNALLVPQYTLPAVFSGNPHSSAVNGVLWTLQIECLCYATTAALGVIFGRREWIGMALFGALAGATSLMPPELGLDQLKSIGEVCVFFALGSIYFHLGVTATFLPLAPIVAALPMALLIHRDQAVAAHVFAWFVVPYVVLAVGVRSWPGVRSAARFGDISYGMYLWGFVVEQTCLWLWPGLPFALNLIIAIAVTAVVATASWHLVEKRVLRFKRRSVTDPDGGAIADAPLRMTYQFAHRRAVDGQAFGDGQATAQKRG